MVVAITGSCGMIGSNLCHWLIDNTEHFIVGIDNKKGGYVENMPELSNRFHFRNFDLDCLSTLNSCFRHYKPDIVYHFAAYAAENLSPFIRNYNYINNLVCTANVVNACINHDVKRLVFASSIAVYGHGKPPFTEADMPIPNDPYGNAKLSCEIDIKIAGEQHGLDWCIVRPYNVYGIRQNISDKYRNVIGIFINQYLNQKPFTIFGDGSQKRAFTNVEDIMHPLYVAAISPNTSKQIINLGSTNKYTVKEVAEILQEIVCGGEIEYLDARHEVHNAYAQNYKAVAFLDFKETIPLYEGIKKMYNWCLKNRREPTKFNPEYEITKGMYKAWQR